MLVLTRKVGEEIVIGNNTILKIVEIRGGKVKLGFAAPQEVRVLRSELSDQQRQPPRTAS